MEFEGSMRLFLRNRIRINAYVVNIVFFREKHSVSLVNKPLLICGLDIKAFWKEINFLHCILI